MSTRIFVNTIETSQCDVTTRRNLKTLRKYFRLEINMLDCEIKIDFIYQQTLKSEIIFRNHVLHSRFRPVFRRSSFAYLKSIREEF